MMENGKTCYGIPKDRTVENITAVLLDHPDIFEQLEVNIRLQFRDWYPKNMHVINTFERRALELKTYGNRKRYGIGAITERLRWDSLVRQDSKESPFKLSNNHRATLARIIMQMNPVLENMFNLRGRRGRVKETQDSC